MSAPAKMRPIEVEIKIDGKAPKKAKVTPKVLDAILRLLGGGKKSFSLEEVFPEMKDPAKRAAAALRGFRSRDGLTQVALAKRLDVTQGDISQMESGRRAIGKGMAMRLAKVFGVDYRVFL